MSTYVSELGKVILTFISLHALNAYFPIDFNLLLKLIPVIPVEEKAYVDLEKMGDGEERKKILEMILANIEGGYLEFCKVCGGFGIDNNNRVETAKQLKKA